MMFKIVILPRYYNLSDDSTEYAILDRLSFMRLLRLTLPIPYRIPRPYEILRTNYLLSKLGASQGRHRVNEHNLQLIPLDTTEDMSIKGVVAPIGANDASCEAKTSDKKVK